MCWSNHWDTRDAWQPRRIERPARADVRISDSERQATIDQLSRHTGDGRLTLEEFEARVDETWRAKTRGDLDVVLRELPVERTPIRHRARERHWPLRAVTFWVALALFFVVTVGPSSLWWIVPIAWFRFRGFRHHHRNDRHDAMATART